MTDLPHFSRRSFMRAIASALVVTDASASPSPTAQLSMIQAHTGGRLGVFAFEVRSGRSIGINEHDRFALCSTFKLLLAACVLARVDARKLDLQHPVRFGAADMLSHAPATSAKLTEGAMTVRELCAAAVEVSDNPAANLLLSLIGGPAGLTAYLRQIGDEVTRLDRPELALNSNLPGDPRDTTTPYAMSRSVANILTGDLLRPASRQLLIEWLIASPTGRRRVRAGLPAGWKAGDKTGTGANGAVNDVAIFWTPAGSPVIASVYMSESRLPVSDLELLHAQVGRLIAATLATS